MEAGTSKHAQIQSLLIQLLSLINFLTDGVDTFSNESDIIKKGRKMLETESMKGQDKQPFLCMSA